MKAYRRKSVLNRRATKETEVRDEGIQEEECSRHRNSQRVLSHHVQDPQRRPSGSERGDIVRVRKNDIH